jgi:hypothetical protein
MIVKKKKGRYVTKIEMRRAGKEGIGIGRKIRKRIRRGIKIEGGVERRMVRKRVPGF